ncbi:MAG: four helix bundle protein [Terriglobales bacterium]
MAQSYRDLKVWQKAVAMVTDVYRFTRIFPREELYGLTSQIRRAAVSVPSNIAEGKGRSNKDFSRFLLQARGSLLELETQLQIACNLAYLPPEAFQELIKQTEELGRMLNGMLSALQRADANPAP